MYQASKAELQPKIHPAKMKKRFPHEKRLG
jgi:hypothetical protein